MKFKLFARLFYALIALAAPLALTACVVADSDADAPQMDQPPPEQPQADVEMIPMIQDPRSEIWIPGYWGMSDHQFVWVPGKVVPRPSPTAVWATARWVRHNYGWSFQQGHWE